MLYFGQPDGFLSPSKSLLFFLSACPGFFFTGIDGGPTLKRFFPALFPLILAGSFFAVLFVRDEKNWKTAGPAAGRMERAAEKTCEGNSSSGWNRKDGGRPFQIHSFSGCGWLLALWTVWFFCPVSFRFKTGLCLWLGPQENLRCFSLRQELRYVDKNKIDLF